MNSVSRWIVLSAGVLVGLAGTAGNVSACHKCRSVTYYAPVATSCCPPTTCCAPPAPTLVPVTVTTTRCGLFGLHKRTTVTYGAPIPAPAPAPVLAAPPPPAPVFAPPPPVPATSGYPPFAPSPGRVIITYP